jgi:hypothetical protein
VAVAAWKTEQHLRDHYGEHGAEFPGSSLADYEASAQQTLDVGTYFEFFDDVSSEWRLGCYHRETRRFTVLDEDDRIVSHFRSAESYVRGLLESNYD